MALFLRTTKAAVFLARGVFFFLTFDLQKGQALAGPPKKGLRQVYHYPNWVINLGFYHQKLALFALSVPCICAHCSFTVSFPWPFGSFRQNIIVLIRASHSSAIGGGICALASPRCDNSAHCRHPASSDRDRTIDLSVHF